MTSCLFHLSFCGHLQRLLLGFELITFLRMTENTFYWRSARWTMNSCRGLAHFSSRCLLAGRQRWGEHRQLPLLSAPLHDPVAQRGRFQRHNRRSQKVGKTGSLLCQNNTCVELCGCSWGGKKGETSAHKTSNCDHNLLICGEKVIN